MNLQIHLMLKLQYENVLILKKYTNLYFRVLIYKIYKIKLSFIQKQLTPAHRWQKCATKTLGTHDWICKVALSSEVIMTIVLGREKMMQLMI